MSKAPPSCTIEEIREADPKIYEPALSHVLDAHDGNSHWPASLARLCAVFSLMPS